MIKLRKSTERGHANHGWLDSWHSFSFADYYDPAHVQFGALRVINEDRVAPGGGFGTHGHRDMEIITYPLAGALEHKDSMGNGTIIHPGDVQRMSAGSGVHHSEYNHSTTEPVHFLQIWLLPRSPGGPPSYAQQHFSEADKRGQLCCIAAGTPQGRAVPVQQDVTLYAGLFDGAETATLSLATGRRAYVHLARGELVVNGQLLQAGDALMVEEETQLTCSHGKQAEVLAFDLA